MCRIEGCKYPSVNKKYDLCPDHNYERLHGRSKREVYSERKAAKPIKIYTFKRSTKPIQQTKKEASVKKELSAVKQKIELDAIFNDEYYCQGCGCSHPGLDKSHLCSVGQYKSLELIGINIQLMCRRCHQAWESRIIARMIKLFCFWDNLRAIKTICSEEFQLLLTKVDEYIKWLPENEEKNVVVARRNDL